MKKSTRLFWVAALGIFLAGCSHQRHRLPASPDPAEEIPQDMPVVKVGQQVKIVTTDGSKFEGEVVSVSGEELVLGKTGNYGFEKTVFHADEIVEIRSEKVSGIVTGISVGVAVIAALGVLMLSQIEWGSS